MNSDFNPLHSDGFSHTLSITVKTVSNGHSKIDKSKNKDLNDKL